MSGKKRGAVMILRHVAVAIIVALVAIILSCTPDVAGGGGTEWEAKVSGYTVYDGSGLPASGAKVFLYPEHFLQDTANGQLLRQTTADNNGYFVFDRLEPGVFHIEVNDNKSWASLSECEIPAEDTAISLACALKPTSRISGKIAIPAGYRGGAYVQVYGLARIARAAVNGEFAINDVPQGDYTLRVLPSNREYLPRDVAGIAVTSSSGVTIGALPVPINDSIWKYRRPIHLNTSPSGAGIRNNVLNFPVLVRLSTGNFDFSQGASDGADIRFTKANGLALPYEIERWDARNSRAEIWVNVDTIYANDTSRYIVMHWGASAVSSTSDGPGVFDTAKGFQGVWHLAGSTAIEKDATGNHYDGTASDTAPAYAEGSVGPCKSFDGMSGIRMNGTAGGKLNFPENGTYTFSAWAYADTLDNGFHLVAGKGNEQYFLKFKTAAPVSTSMVWEFVEYSDNSGWSITNTLPAIPSAKTWMHVVGVRNGTAQQLYINGELVDSTVTISSDNVPRRTEDDVTIGKFSSIPPDSLEGMCAFLGKIDEVRILNRACGTDWIRLCYMNQKEQDALVKW
jgi:hypothetical protein